jgi:hypothetical protein
MFRDRLPEACIFYEIIPPIYYTLEHIAHTMNTEQECSHHKSAESCIEENWVYRLMYCLKFAKAVFSQYAQLEDLMTNANNIYLLRYHQLRCCCCFNQLSTFFQLLEALWN